MHESREKLEQKHQCLGEKRRYKQGRGRGLNQRAELFPTPFRRRLPLKVSPSLLLHLLWRYRQSTAAYKDKAERRPIPESEIR